jgi:hypothetical protein
MGVRERVQEAINASTGRAEKVLSEAAHADEHERLTILVSGWFRGIAAALEEIALELDARATPKGETGGASDPTPPESPSSTSGDDSSVGPEEARSEEAKAEPSESSDEATLLERARQSTEETRALRAERDSAPDETQGS